MDIVNNNISSPRTLSNDELEFYHKHGYLIVKNVFNGSDFKEFEDDYAKLIDIKAKELFEQKKITDLKKDLISLDLKKPVCASKGDRITLSRMIGARWRLIGYGNLD